MKSAYGVVFVAMFLLVFSAGRVEADVYGRFTGFKTAAAHRTVRLSRLKPAPYRVYQSMRRVPKRIHVDRKYRTPRVRYKRPRLTYRSPRIQKYRPFTRYNQSYKVARVRRLRMRRR